MRTPSVLFADTKRHLKGALRVGLVVSNQGLNSVANLAISLFLIQVLGVTEFGIYAVYSQLPMAFSPFLTR